MLFHTKKLDRRGFGGGGSGGGAEAVYRPDPARLVVALILLLGFAVCAFLSHRASWDDGSKGFMHLVEVAFGLFTGVFFGEKAALDKK